MKKQKGIFRIFNNTCLLFIIFGLIAVISTSSGCGGGGSSGGGGDSGTNSSLNGLAGTWEGGMYPGHSISFEVEVITGENYIIYASGDYVAVGCFNYYYNWNSDNLHAKIVNNECHIYFPDDINYGDGRGMELHIYFDSNTECHGTWVGETFCEPLIDGTLKAYHCIDKDNDGYDSCNECDDDNANVNWDAEEICDGIDNDCNGEIDEGVFYPDNDGDGYGDATAVGQSCPAPADYVRDNTDCDDSDPSINPGREEIWGNFLDDNCDGQIDEGFETISTISINNPGALAITPNGDYLYVINYPEDLVHVIRTSDNTIVDDISVGANPTDLVVTKDAKYVYVTHSQYLNNSVSVIQTSDNTVIDSIPLGANAYPECIAVSPNGDYVYVENYIDDSVSVIRTSDNTVIDDIYVGSSSVDILVTPNGDYVYVTHYSSDYVSVIRTSDNTVISAIPCDNPRGIAITPSGDYIYVTNYLETGTVSVIRTSDNTIIDTISVGPEPNYVAVSPDGEYVYVVNRGTVTYSTGPTGTTANYSKCSVSVILASNNTVLRNIPMGDGPSSIVMTPNGDRAYVTVNPENLITVVGIPD